jgi:hypothetical protein
MWHTSEANRVLEDLERDFYLEISLAALDQLNEYCDYDDYLDMISVTEDRIFDSASFYQKALMLQNALMALIDKDVETPTLTNTVEASAYFPFAVLIDNLELEIGMKDDAKEANYKNGKYIYYWRKKMSKMSAKYCLQESKKDKNINHKSTDIYIRSYPLLMN